MAEFPALPLFTDAYLADTRHLSTVEHGAYLLLLMMAWRTADCALPDDDRILARWAGMDGRGWSRIKSNVMAFWQLRNINGKPAWVQLRLLDERRFVGIQKRRQSSNARARWLKTKETTHATAMPNLCQTDAPTPTPHSIEEPISLTLAKDIELKPVYSRKKQKIELDVPDRFAKEFYAFIEDRKNRRSPMTDLAKKILLKKLLEMETKGYSPHDLIKLAIEHNWKTVYEPKQEIKSGNLKLVAKSRQDGKPLDDETYQLFTGGTS